MKIISILSLITVCSLCNAQSADTVKTKIAATPTSATDTPEQKNEFKINARNFTTELNVNLFQGSLSLNNTLQQIKVRYFVNNNFAYRFALNFNSKNSSNGSSSPYGTNPNNFNDDRKSTTFGVGLGIEKHFTGTDRLSPYIGAEISIVNKSSSETITSNSVTTNVDGAWMNYNSTYIPNYGYVTTSSYDEWGFFRYGVNLVGGFDYYVARHIYVGYEFIFQYYNTKYKDVSVTVTGQSQNNTPTTKGSDTFIGPSVINGIRVGFVF